MDIQLTDDGLKALTENKSLTMVKFIAGSSLDLQSMRTYFSSNNYTGPYSYYQYDVDSSRTYLKGDTYTKPDGTNVTCTENFLEVIGSLNCQDPSLPASFTMRSLGVTARSGSGPLFIYAWGALASSDTPYPVNRNEAITYITPARIIYNSSSNVTLEDPHVPWKNFIEHTDTSVNSEDGAHGLKINPNTREMTIGNTTITLSSGGERLDRLEQEMQGVLKYHQSDAREYNSEWVDRMEGTGTSSDPYRIYTPKDFYSMRLTSEDSSKNYFRQNAYFTLENNLDFGPILGVSARMVNGTVSVTVTDSNAPLFNATQSGGSTVALGWDNVSLPEGCYFDGKNHHIKNLYIGNYTGSNYKWGLFQEIGRYATVCNLSVTDSLYFAAKYSSSVGAISSVCSGYVINCSSNADLVSSTDDYSIGGIIGWLWYAYTKVHYCSFHGSIYNTTYAEKGYIGGICGRTGGDAVGNSDRIVGCYSDANINFGQFRGGLIGSFGGPKSIISCYFAGCVTPTAVDNGLSASLYGNKTASDVAMTNCYSLEGSALTVQGTAVSQSEILSQEMPASLNLGLPEARFSYRQGLSPRLDFEQDNIPWDSPLAVIDTENNFVLDSGYNVRDLQSIATQQDLSMAYQIGAGIVQGFSKVVVFDLTIQPSEWDSSLRYRLENSVFVNQDLTRPVIVYDSQEMIDADIYVERTDSGYINLRCNTLPSLPLSFYLLVIVNQ